MQPSALRHFSFSYHSVLHFHLCNRQLVNHRLHSATSEGTKETGVKGEKIDFKIWCHKRCRKLEILVTHNTGDIDLYGQEEDIPHIV